MKLLAIFAILLVVWFACGKKDQSSLNSPEAQHERKIQRIFRELAPEHRTREIAEGILSAAGEK